MLVAVEPGTGLVKAMALNRSYSLDQSRNGPHTNWHAGAEATSNYPNTVNPMLGGGDMPGYQAGSTFKWFVLLAALDAGMPLSTTIYSPAPVPLHLLRRRHRSSCGGRYCARRTPAAPWPATRPCGAGSGSR